MHTREKRNTALRWVCFAVLLTATVLRAASEIAWDPLLRSLHNTEQAPTTPIQTIGAAVQEQSYPTMLYEPPQHGLFTAEDAALVPVFNQAGASFDAGALITQPLPLTLDVDGPVVLIVHSHASEAYAETGGDHHTTDTAQNVVRVGQALADRLNTAGIPTLHDTTLNDVPGYNDAYERTAAVIERYLETYPSIQMVIDVHRDAILDSEGNELPLTAELDGAPAAQLLLVMGTDTQALPHPNWQSNLSVALKLQAFCQREAPGLFRNLALRAARYNEHLTPCSLLLEVGASGNTLDEALRSAEFFADQLAALIQASQ